MNPVNWGMIFMVFIVSVAFSAVLAVAFYYIDRNAERHDKQR